MDGFQTTVLGIAVALLIIILAVVGVVMVSNKKSLIYPPTSLPCPNYWQMNADGTCAIPIAPALPPSVNPEYVANYTSVNIGSLDKDKPTYKGKPLPGFDKLTGNINFSDSNWGTSAGSATCAKREWAKQSGIFWDGITNYNGCA